MVCCCRGKQIAPLYTQLPVPGAHHAESNEHGIFSGSVRVIAWLSVNQGPSTTEAVLYLQIRMAQVYQPVE
jgi:hypothetical protein